MGTFLGWPDMSVVAPEEPIVDPRISVGNGYGESKYVTEKVCRVYPELHSLILTIWL